jgi:hypothetical protein
MTLIDVGATPTLTWTSPNPVKAMANTTMASNAAAHQPSSSQRGAQHGTALSRG